MSLLVFVLLCGVRVFYSSAPPTVNNPPSNSGLRTESRLKNGGYYHLRTAGRPNLSVKNDQRLGGEIESESLRAESWFAGKSLSEIKSALEKMRPEAVRQSDKTFLMKDLPLVNADNRIGDKRDINALYWRLEKTLKFFKREAVVELIIFRHSQPIVYSKPGVALPISTELLKIVGSDDAALVGIVAHELAHEYFALQFYEALQSGNLARMRELELFCDAVAVVVILDLGFDPGRYARTLKRIVGHSRESAELNKGANSHPDLKTRLKLIDDVSKLFDRSGSTQGPADPNP